MTVKDIDRIVESKEDAVAAVVLLDQLPRNMFRGMEAAKVFHLIPFHNKKLMRGVQLIRSYSEGSRQIIPDRSELQQA